jgi:hypothetical protein
VNRSFRRERERERYAIIGTVMQCNAMQCWSDGQLCESRLRSQRSALSSDGWDGSLGGREGARKVLVLVVIKTTTLHLNFRPLQDSTLKFGTV